MPPNTKKAKARKTIHSPNGSSTIAKMKEAEKKIERLELLSLAQDLEHFTTKISALKIKQQQLQAEANVTSRDLAEIQVEGQKMYQTFQAHLATFKKMYDVPEGKEINLRTGELVDPPPPPQAQAQEGAPLPNQQQKSE